MYHPPYHKRNGSLSFKLSFPSCKVKSLLNTISFPSGAFAMNRKGNVVLYLDKELVDKSKELGFNLSKTFENHLKQLISQLSNSQSMHNGLPSKNETLWWAGPDSDRRPSARQADVLTRLDDRPTFLSAIQVFGIRYIYALCAKSIENSENKAFPSSYLEW